MEDKACMNLRVFKLFSVCLYEKGDVITHALCTFILSRNNLVCVYTVGCFDCKQDNKSFFESPPHF